jgi:hypothetical protein
VVVSRDRDDRHGGDRVLAHEPAGRRSAPLVVSKLNTAMPSSLFAALVLGSKSFGIRLPDALIAIVMIIGRLLDAGVGMGAYLAVWSAAYGKVS